MHFQGALKNTNPIEEENSATLTSIGDIVETGGNGEEEKLRDKSQMNNADETENLDENEQEEREEGNGAKHTKKHILEEEHEL